MELSDTLSRAYLHESGTPVEIEVESINVMHSLPVDSARLENIRASMETDESMQELKKVILKGWPDKKSDVSGQVRQYFGVRDELTVQHQRRLEARPGMHCTSHILSISSNARSLFD